MSVPTSPVAGIVDPKAPVATVEQAMKSIWAATEPSRVDWYLDRWPEQEPAARTARAIGEEARKFHSYFATWQRPRRKDDDGPDESVGDWLNETITKSPVINDKKDRGHLWDGARRSLVARVDELTGMMEAVNDFKTRYDIDLHLTSESIRSTQRRIEERLKEAHSDRASYVGTMTMLGAMGGMAVGAVGAARRNQLAEAAGKAMMIVGGVVGGAVGGVTADVTGNSVARITRINDDLNRLKTLREKESLLEAEGVKAKTVDGVVQVMAEYNREMQILSPSEKDRRRRTQARLENKLKELLDDNQNKQKAASQGWGRLQPMLAAALAGRDVGKLAEVLVTSCDIGNGFRRDMESASKVRTESLMLGWAGGRMTSPLDLPDSAWR